ncbi:MAG: hypothetical protein FH748_04110 [Balneolaceae bacterium]|nr:hypothetical protein [Balneolaceae bacterium]
MIVQSPLKKHDIRPNLRKVPKPGKQAGKSTSNRKPKSQSSRQGIKVPKVTPWKVILGSLIIGALGVLYLTHVFATQYLLEEVKQLEAEYNIARSAHDELKLRYDRMIGPSEIYDKAEEQGFVNGGPAEQVIIIEE